MPTANPSQARRRRVDGRTRAARAVGRASREEILTAALKVFAARGYRDAGVDEIAAEAGYSKGAVYWHFADKEGLLSALLEERIDAPTRERVGLLASAPPERDMSVEATREFARQTTEAREVLLLEREYGNLAIRDPDLGERYRERQAELRDGLAAALAARARHLGAPELLMSADDLARVVTALVSGLAFDELIEPGAVRPGLVGEALAVIYAGLVARAPGRESGEPS